MAIASSLLFAVALAFGNDPGLSSGAAAPPPETFWHPLSVPGPLETPASQVDVGDVAPDFSFKSYDGEWRRLADLRAQGPVLLVISPDSRQLRSLQAERDRLLDLGVVPVAVCDVSPGTAYALVRDLKLGFSVLADPQHVIANQFNAVDPRTTAATPAWFVVDQKGRVRAMGHDAFPQGGFAPLASRALGVPLGAEPRPASNH